MSSMLLAAALALQPAISTVVPAHPAAPRALTVGSAPAALSPRVPVPLVLPAAPVASDPTTRALADARLAIARAQAVDPAAAQAASFEYFAALQQYRAGNVAGANISALQAFATAGRGQVEPLAAPAAAAPLGASAAPQRPGTGGGLYGADAPAVDADAFIALARGMLNDCAARHDKRLGTARARFAAAQRDFAARDWQATRADAKAAIDACPEPAARP